MCLQFLSLLEYISAHGWLKWIAYMLGACGTGCMEATALGEEEDNKTAREPNKCTFIKFNSGVKWADCLLSEWEGADIGQQKPLQRVLINCCVLCYRPGCNDQVWIVLIRLGMILWALKSWFLHTDGFFLCELASEEKNYASVKGKGL